MTVSEHALRPLGRPAGFQRWRHLLFLHWAVEPELVQRVLPPELEVEVFGGKAWLGVVPFTMRDVAPRWSPSVPGISHFHELNVRSYVRRGNESGVWFFSLDAASTVAVLAARAGWHLPYHRASMTLTLEGERAQYQSRRRWPKPLPAELACDYRIGADRGHATRGTLEYFLLERYVLFAPDGSGRMRIGRVHHVPYPVHDAHVARLEHSMTAAAGLPPCEGAPLAHYSPGVDVDIYALAAL